MKSDLNFNALIAEGDEDGEHAHESILYKQPPGVTDFHRLDAGC